MFNLAKPLIAAVIVASSCLVAAAAQAADAAWTCQKVQFNQTTGPLGTNPSTVRADFTYRHVCDITSSATTRCAPLGGGVADTGCGGHVISENSALRALITETGGVGAIGPSVSLTGTRDLSLTAVLTQSDTLIAATAVSNSNVSLTLNTPVNALEVRVTSNSVVGNLNQIHAVIYEQPNK